MFFTDFLFRMSEYGGRSSVGRAPDCDSGCRGFEPHRPPQLLKSGVVGFIVLLLSLKFQEVVISAAGSIRILPTHFWPCFIDCALSGIAV